MAYYRDRKPSEVVREMKEKTKIEKIDDNYIRNLVAMQNGELNAKSSFYDGNILEGNWSFIEDSDIVKSCEIETDAWDIISGKIRTPDEEYEKRKAEIEYVFRPSLYAVHSLILYYLEDYRRADTQAKRVYNLKNAVIRRDKDEFYGGLPFVLKYINWILLYRDSYLKENDDGGRDDYFKELSQRVFENSLFTDVLKEFKNFMEDLFTCSNELLDINNIEDEFINDIVDCIRTSMAEELIIEMRIEDIEKDKEKLLLYSMINDYEILMHPAIEKVDFKHLQEYQINSIKEHINKTPRHPYNDSPSDSERMHGKLKDWFKQKVSSPKEKMVYKKDEENKKVYIATVSDHYKYAEGRTRSTVAYR